MCNPLFVSQSRSSPVSELDIPEDIKERFLSMGMKLKWCRYLTENRIDIQNIRRKQKEGYTFVTPEEMGEDNESLMAQLESLDKFGDIISVGDLALMKIPEYKAEARKKYFQQRTKEQTEAVEEVLRQNAISNSSHRKVRTGKFAHFSGE